MALILIASFCYCMKVVLYTLFIYFYLDVVLCIFILRNVHHCSMRRVKKIPKCNISQAGQSVIDLWFGFIVLHGIEIRKCIVGAILNTPSTVMLKQLKVLHLKENSRPTNLIHQYTNLNSGLVFGFLYPACLLKFTHLEFLLVGWNPIFYAAKEFFLSIKYSQFILMWFGLNLFPSCTTACILIFW